MLVFIIAIYQRPELSKIVLDYYYKLSKKYGFKVVIAGSEGEKSRLIAKNFHYIEVKNFPVSHKNNAMMRKSREFNPDAVVLLGSDDFICENVIKYYYKLIQEKENRVVGFKDLYFYGAFEQYLSHFKVIDKGFGAGRFFPRLVLDKIDFLGWYGKLNRGLDGNNMSVLNKNNIKSHSINLSEIDGFILDVKTDFNISNKNIIFTGEQINTKIMTQKRIPKKRIDNIKPKEVEKVIKPVDVIDIYDFEEGKNYDVEATGESKFMPKGKKYNLTGLQAKLLAKKGAITFKG